MKYKTKNGKYCCDVDKCSNYAYAELYRASKSAWMYVCNKHYSLKLNKNRRPKEKGVGFYILTGKEKKVSFDNG